MFIELSIGVSCIFVSLHLNQNKNIYYSIICATQFDSCKNHIWHVAASELTTNHYYLVNEIHKRATPCTNIYTYT